MRIPFVLRVQTPSEFHNGRQGGNEVRWIPGQEVSLAPPYLNLRSFGSKCTVLKNVLATLVGHFITSRSHSAPLAVIRHPGNCAPFAPLRYAPDGRQFKGLAMAAALLNCFVGYNFEYCHIVAENKFADALRQNGNVRWFSVEN